MKTQGWIDLSGKNVIVTGGASGIGLKIAENLYKNKATVIICDLNESEEAKSIRRKELEEILVKDKGAEEAKKIIAEGDIQLKRAIEEMNKKIK